MSKPMEGEKMKTLIIYASKYGCTADCATYLKDKLSGDVALIDINKANKKIELESFSSVIIGGSIYASQLYSKELRMFCKNNTDTLRKKKIGIFLCCAQVDEAREFFTKNFPAELLEHAKATEIFGSEARLEKMKFLDKKILNLVTKGDFSSFTISYENIDKFAKIFN